MASDSILDLIEEQLTALESGPPADQESRIDALKRIYGEIESILEHPGEVALGSIRALGFRFNMLAEKEAKAILAEVTARWTRGEAQDPSSPVTLDQVQLMIGLLNGVAGFHPAATTERHFKDLQGALEQRARSLQTQRDFERVLAQARELQERSLQLESASPSEAITLLQTAGTKVSTAVNAPEAGWNTAQRDQLIILEAELNKAYDDLRNRYEVPITRQEGGELVGVIVFFAQLPQDTQVIYFRTAELSEAVMMPAGEAVEIARNRLLHFWRRKVGEYTGAAETSLKAHHPGEAQTNLSPCENLPGLRDHRVNLRIPDNLQLQIDNWRRRIADDAQRLEEAERKLEEARTAREVPAAYRAWQSAQDIWPYHPDLDGVRAQLVPKVRARVSQLTEEFEQALLAEHWSIADDHLTRLRECIDLDIVFRAEFGPRASELQQINDDIQPLARARKTSMNLHSALLERVFSW